MKKIRISDVTLRENNFSFKEKIDIAKLLEKLCVDFIEMPKIVNERVDTLFLHTVSPIIKDSKILCPVDNTKESIDKTVEAIKAANHPVLKINVPVSTVQMEYLCHKKPKFVIEMIEEVISYAASKGLEVEFSALDATRSEYSFLCQAIETAINAGAKYINICDSAGVFLPTEFVNFIKNIKNDIKGLENVSLSCECSNELKLALSASISAVDAGVDGIVTTMCGENAASLRDVSKLISERGDSIGVTTNLKHTVINHSIDKVLNFSSLQLSDKSDEINNSEIVLKNSDSIEEVAEAVRKLGYALFDDDMQKVYDEFKIVSTTKPIGLKELDVIVASAAMQVTPTYKVESFVINNGNIIKATANISILKSNNETISGVATGDGPIDAAFNAIDQVIGSTYELDDFQIQSVTRGREAVGTALVRLRYDGMLYSGFGISTDIIGASINAYINAVNKACVEQ